MDVTTQFMKVPSFGALKIRIALYAALRMGNWSSNITCLARIFELSDALPAG